MDFFNFFFPNYCVECGKESKEALCFDCWKEFKKSSLKKSTNNRCEICYHKKHNGKCKFCSSRFLYFDSLYALYEYNSNTRKVLLDWKYQNYKAVYRLFVSEVVKYVKKIQPNRIGFIGSQKFKKNTRSYEVLELLVRQVSKKTNVPWGKDIVKIKTTKQSKNKQLERFLAISTSFELTKEIKYVDKYLLVEDTVTTGATINEVSRLLKEIGIKEVHVLSIFLEDFDEEYYGVHNEK
ncbi:MAG: phosphoribosyltransferase family protein [Leptospiraceae bacterium]|nr:phosphoribosyltransferase family protein [Leptospiraceae bacterium]MDW7975032.1 phosphoribosyltransferase family protein [Leptospiraceae bacterium]